MKTYLLDIINRIKRFSATLDARTALCNRPWVVFNDSGDKEVLIFDTDGSVLITVNGIGVKRTWQWISANKSLIISQPDDSIVMLHPDYFNDFVIALNRDGTSEYAFLIDGNNPVGFAPKTLAELNDYFTTIEQNPNEEKRKEDEKRLHQEKVDNARNKFEATVVEWILYLLVILPLMGVIAICLYGFINGF